MNIFKRERKPDELVMKACNAFEELASAKSATASENLSRYLKEMKVWLYGEPGEQSAKEDTIPALVTEVCKSKLLTYFCTRLGSIEFEASKDVAQIFNAVLRRPVGGKDIGVQYMVQNKELATFLLRGYKSIDAALVSGSMLREIMKIDVIARMLLDVNFFRELSAFTDVETFEIASDAFVTFRELLSQHGDDSSDFLLMNCEVVFDEFNNRLLKSQNYVTRRQSIKLLGELLLSPSNIELMMVYIAGVENLMLIMTLLRDPSRNIAFEAFHVFKVFVANPNKSPAVLEVLVKNTDKLLRFLSDFQGDREDEDFAKEKEMLCVVLKQLTPP